MSKKRILVFTGTRADYGLLHPLLNEMLTTKGLKPTLLIGGEHFWNVESFRETQSIPELTHRLLMPLRAGNILKDATLAKRALSQELAFTEFITTSKKAYDALIVLGDRYEAMAVAMAAFYHDIPVIQLAAGDCTEGGCPDDRLRFAITALAKGVVCFSKASAKRVRRLGLHDDSCILHTSSLSVDNALSIPMMTKAELLTSLGMDVLSEFVLFTQHPVPAEGESTVVNFAESLEGLSSLQAKNVEVIATLPNMDVVGDDFAQIIEGSKQQDTHIHWVESLGAERYLNALRHALAVVGNSSSGLYESPLFGTPCINIGPRQAGRERAANVIDVDYGSAFLKKALNNLWMEPKPKARIDSPFGNTPASTKIIGFIEEIV